MFRLCCCLKGDLLFKKYVKMSHFEFKAVTKYSGKLKTLFEIIFQNLPTATLKIDATGILLEETTNQNLLISVHLPASKFDEYHFNGKEQSYSIGLGNNINKEFFKSVKNKDKITMSTSGPFNFVFEKEGKDTTQSLSVTTQDVIILKSDKKEYIVDPVKLPSEEYSQLCRSFSSPKMTVTKQCGQIVFSFKTPRSEKKLTCGLKDVNDMGLIHREYYCEQFSRLSKIQSLTNECIEVYYEKENPLKFVIQNDLMDFQVIIYEQPENN
jgi:hypothetical protein